jgi:hypothetical protein
MRNPKKVILQKLRVEYWRPEVGNSRKKEKYGEKLTWVLNYS